jgi:hypothetical protein
MFKRLNTLVIIAVCTSCALIAFAFYQRHEAPAQCPRSRSISWRHLSACCLRCTPNLAARPAEAKERRNNATVCRRIQAEGISGKIEQVDYRNNFSHHSDTSVSSARVAPLR